VPEEIFRYFPLLSELQKKRLSLLKEIYEAWNSKINVISRKDMDNFLIHHVLHSLAIAKVITFLPSTKILDAGTGGGFPGIPLSILFPDSEFTLLDSVGKKIKVVRSVINELGLKNVQAKWERAEDEEGKYDFVVCRAVSKFTPFVKMVAKNIEKDGNNTLRNGIIYLKGGGLKEELKFFKDKTVVWDICDFFSEPFFETKKIVYLPV